MAANIEERNGVGSFVTAGGRQNKPWHGLGVIFDDPRISIEMAIEASRANYNVRKDYLVRVTAEDIKRIKEGQPIETLLSKDDIIYSHQCTVREDLGTILGVVGSGYEVVQNLTGFEFVNDVLNGINGTFDQPFIETAGVLGHGERMFVTAKFNEPIRIKGTDDIIDDYILFTNAHDGSGAVIAQFCTTRVVCNNTLNMALAESKNKVYFKHTKNVHGKIDMRSKENLNMALSILRGHQVYIQTLKETVDNFADIKLSENNVKDIVSKIYMEPKQIKEWISNNRSFNGLESISTRTKNTIENVLNTIDSGVGQENWRGSGLWVLNGITSYYQNNKTYNKGQEAKFDSIMNGDVYKKVQTAYNVINDYALAA